MSKKYGERVILNIVENNAQAEQDAGENLHEKFDGTNVVFTRNEVHHVNVPTPTSQAAALLNKQTIVAAVNGINPVGADSILYVIAHADPDSKRFAGLEAIHWAEILGNRDTFRHVKRIHIIGCHAAGEVKSAEQARAPGTLAYSVTGFYSFAGVLHQMLKGYGLRTEVASYCSYVRISPFGEIRTGFQEGGSRVRHTESAKVVFKWDSDSTRSMTFPH